MKYCNKNSFSGYWILHNACIQEDNPAKQMMILDFCREEGKLFAKRAHIKRSYIHQGTAGEKSEEQRERIRAGARVSQRIHQEEPQLHELIQ